jgi:hypothetical protein
VSGRREVEVNVVARQVRCETEVQSAVEWQKVKLVWSCRSLA